MNQSSSGRINRYVDPRQERLMQRWGHEDSDASGEGGCDVVSANIQEEYDLDQDQKIPFNRLRDIHQMLEEAGALLPPITKGAAKLALQKLVALAQAMPDRLTCTHRKKFLRVVYKSKDGSRYVYFGKSASFVGAAHRLDRALRQSKPLGSSRS